MYLLISHFNTDKFYSQYFYKIITLKSLIVNFTNYLLTRVIVEIMKNIQF